jgi:hypothetical protein
MGRREAQDVDIPREKAESKPSLVIGIESNNLFYFIISLIVFKTK